MATHLYLLSYNNYLNRQVKWHDSTNLYLEYDSEVVPNYNFNPNDGISTEIVLNIGDYSAPDYIVVVDDDNHILSRWFIIDRQRIRAGQSKFTLRRDVIVDNFEAVKTAPCFIEKAMLGFDDVRIFNKENMSFNQIKTSETLLKDKTGCPWIVGYYDKSSNVRGDKITEQEYNNVGTIPSNEPLDVPYIQLETPIEDWEFYNASNLKGGDNAYYTDVNNAYTYKFTFSDFIGPYYSSVYKSDIIFNNNTINYNFEWGHDKSADSATTPPYGVQVRRPNSGASGSAGGGGLAADTINVFRSAFPNAISSIGGISALNSIAKATLGTTEEKLSELLSLQGKLLRDSNGKVYRVQSINIGSWETKTIDAKERDPLFLGMDGITSYLKGINNNNGYPYVFGSANNKTYKLVGQVRKYTVSLAPMVFEELTYNMSGSKLITTDAPYNIFAIPYGEIDVYTLIDGEQTICHTSAEIAINTAMAIQKNNPGIVYDIQILPYCPVQGLINPEYEKEIYLTSTDQYSTINLGDAIKGVILNVPNGRFTFTIQHNIQTASTAIERKVNNECDMWRLCSPNYNGAFEFSVEKNGGVDFFDVDCEYKPFSPYIHINPDFGGLYGRDFNDPRGLICGGDFSITQIVDQWQQYQIQNKNFQNIFDRQIENMEINQDIQRKMQIWSIASGTLQGGASGATTGFMASGGNPYAAIGGAVVGTAMSAIGGGYDLMYSDKLRNEALDYTKDNFGYQLGNIQALPTMLTRVSAFNNNNKLFPVLEYYTCTEIEKQALRDKIKYNGMTVGTIGKIEDFTDNTMEEVYIKGQIIRIDLPDDYHMTNSIAGEVNKGFYFLGGSE